jgi:hypothetical protein
LVGLLTGCAIAEAANSEIKPASKSFIRKSFTRTLKILHYHGVARNINRRMPEI